MRRWVSNSDSKSVLTGILKVTSGLISKRLILVLNQCQTSKRWLGLVWGVENDKLRVLKRNLLDILSKRKMFSSLAGQFDQLPFFAPCLLEGKLIYFSKRCYYGIRLE